MLRRKYRKIHKTTKISYKIKFIDSYRFMSTSLSGLVNNLSDGVHNDKCTDYTSYLDYMTTKDDQQSCTQLIFRCFECKKNYEKDFNKELNKRFANIYEFCNGDINKFILLLRKGFIHMNTWIVGKDVMKHHCLIKKLFIAA